MPRGYKRNFFAVEASIIDNDKWMNLTWDERGKWLAVRALAERQPTGDFKSAGYLAALMTKEGDTDATETVMRLVEARLLDVSEDARVSIHDMEDYLPETSTERVQRLRNGPKRTETPGNVTYSTDRHTHTAGAPATDGGGRPREEGETLKAYLARIGAPVPDVAIEETTNGKSNGAESPSDPDGKSRRRPGRRTKAAG